MEKRHVLVMVRHGQSVGNFNRQFTGWKDLPLTERGEDEAHRAGKRLLEMGFDFGAVFTSKLVRASRTCELIVGELGRQNVPYVADAALNERDYGQLTGMHRQDAYDRWGEELVMTWRRSYDVPPPDGESVRDTGARVLPFFTSTVLPAVLAADATLMVAHGNSLRALAVALEGIAPPDVPGLKFENCEGRVYEFTADGRLADTRPLSLLEGEEPAEYCH